MNEQRVGGVLQKALTNFVKADRAVIAGVAGSAGAAVAAEGFMVEETLPLSTCGGRRPRWAIHDEGASSTIDAARAHVNAAAETRAMIGRCMVTSPRLAKNVAEGRGEVAGERQGIGRGLAGFPGDTRMARP